MQIVDNQFHNTVIDVCVLFDDKDHNNLQIQSKFVTLEGWLILIKLVTNFKILLTATNYMVCISYFYSTARSKSCSSKIAVVVPTQKIITSYNWKKRT